MDQHKPGASFPTLLAVLAHVTAEGWKVSQSLIYKHKSQGKIRPAKDGTYSPKSVDKYASLFLRRLDGTGAAGQADPGLDSVQKEKVHADARKSTAQAEHWEIRTKVLSGQFVQRDDMERELAGRVAIFRSDGENFFRAEAPAMVEIVHGDPVCIPDLLDLCLTGFEEWLGRYAERSKEFKVPLAPVDALDLDAADLSEAQE
jgi:hypothetical protein